MSKDVTIKKPIINLEAVLAFAEANTGQEAHGALDHEIDLSAALAFAEAKTTQKKDVATQAGSAEGNRERSPSVPMGYKCLTVNLDQWLHKQLSLMAKEQQTTVDEIVGDLVRKYMEKSGFNFGSRGIKVHSGDS
jgi:hypothetical protein